MSIEVKPYRVCEMEGSWYVVKGREILSYEKFKSREGAEWYADALNEKVKSFREFEDKLFKDWVEKVTQGV